MSLFDLDYGSLVMQLLPVKLRQSKMIAWLKVLVSPVIRLYELFKTNRSDDLYRLAHNGQVCYLQVALNDLFDPILRGVLIVDGPFEDPLFTYLVPESKPLWLGLVSEAGGTPFPDPQVLYTSGETSLLGIGFIVKVPVAVAALSGYDEVRLRALVDRYRLPGRTLYSVVTY
jgi:hypothetical protein